MKNNSKAKIIYIPIYILLLFLPKIIGFLFASNGEITDFLSLVAVNIFYIVIVILFVSFLFSKKSVVDFHKDLFLNFVLMGVSSLILLGILEGFSRVIAPNKEKLAYQRMTGTEQRKTIPAPLQGSDYDVPWFMDNFDLLDIKITPNPSYEKALNMECATNPYLTIKNNRRYTTNTPKIDSLDSIHTKLYIFGGSTIFCREVPDSLTIPSYIQRFISKKYPTMEVINCGLQGISTPTQWANLNVIKDSLKKDDIVIFYDGVNNSFSTISNLEKQFVAKQENSNAILGSVMSFLFTFRERLYILLHQKSMLVNWLLYPYSPIEPDFMSQNLTENSTFMLGIDSSASNYAKDIGEAAALCKEKEVIFYHFLQPQLDSRTPKTEFEKMAFIDNPYKRIRYDVVYFNLCYPSFRQKLDSLRTNHNVNTTDISGVFNDYSEDVYLDFCHISQKGNMKVAQTIADYITKE